MATDQPLYRSVRLYLENGSIAARYYEAPGATSAVVWLGSTGGGLDSPAHDLFDHLAEDLFQKQVSSIRFRYRQANDLETSIEDALVALEFLEQRGAQTALTVGFSFGGAVAIQAGARSLLPRAVVGLASQSAGTNGADRISPRPLLLVHGAEDTVLPPECSTLIYERALEPKQLIILPGADHCFDNVAPELKDLLAGWIDQQLAL